MNRQIFHTLPIALAVALASASVPDTALACAVCSGGGEESKSAFIVTTIGLSVLPLAMLGGIGWWIWRRTRQMPSADRAVTTAERAARLPG